MTRLPRQQGGQILIMMTLLIIPMVLMIAYVFNTGVKAANKVRVQNAADAAVLAQAAWTARSLNVMSANNVALTQMMAVDVVVAAYTPAVAEIMGYYVPTEIYYNTLLANANCDNPVGVFNPLCYYYSGRVASLVLLEALGYRYAVLASRIGEIQRHIDVYSRLNAHLARDFPQFSKAVQDQLAAINYSRIETRFYMIGWEPANQERPDRTAVGLPVVQVHRMDLSSGKYQAAFAGAFQWKPVYNTGRRGTSTGLLAEPVAFNFTGHGYRAGRGPFLYARDNAEDGLEEFFKLAKLEDYYAVIFFLSNGWRPSIRDMDPPKYDRCWSEAAGSDIPPYVVIAPFSCLQRAAGTLFPPVYAYAPRQTAVGMGAGAIDIVVLGKRSDPSGWIAPSRFASEPTEVFGMARARVFNGIAPDLYTQNWHSTMVSVGSDSASFRAMRELSRNWGSAIQQTFYGMGESDFRALNTR